MRHWRVHQTLDKRGEVVKGGFDWCQDAECSQQHYLHIPFHGTVPAESKWDGVKHG